MREKFLPIGTVILMKDATKKLMITGYCSATAADVETVYDYVGCLFPEGNLAGDDVALFNHSQIGTIVHMGLEDDEFNKLNKDIIDVLNDEPVQQPVVPSGLDMVPFSPDNMKAILNTIKSQGLDKQYAGPTAFEQEGLHKPIFSMPSLNGSGNKPNDEDEQEEENEISGEFSVDEMGQSEAEVQTEPVHDGTPVLQLQPIYGHDHVSYTNNTATDMPVNGFSFVPVGDGSADNGATTAGGIGL